MILGRLCFYMGVNTMIKKIIIFVLLLLSLATSCFAYDLDFKSDRDFEYDEKNNLAMCRGYKDAYFWGEKDLAASIGFNYYKAYLFNKRYNGRTGKCEPLDFINISILSKKTLKVSDDMICRQVDIGKEMWIKSNWVKKGEFLVATFYPSDIPTLMAWISSGKTIELEFRFLDNTTIQGRGGFILTLKPSDLKNIISAMQYDLNKDEAKKELFKEAVTRIK